MRIVGGALSGRVLVGKPPKGTRPTSDRVREAVASALQARGLLEGAVVLDLFAGTGALGLEALSWGAKRLIAIDDSAAALRCIRDNAAALSLSAQVSAIKLELGHGDPAARAAKVARACPEPITLLLADPPYAQIATLGPLLEALAQPGGPLDTAATILVEHAHKTPFSLPSGFAELARYRYGDTAVLLGLRSA